MRKTLTKSFAVLLVVFMLIGTIPFASFAATRTVASQAELQSALAGASAGDVIDVTSNIALTSSLTVSGKVTIKSSNGSSIQRASSYASYIFVVANGGELTLEDITINGNRTSYQTADLATEMIVVQAGGTLNFNDGTVLTTNRGNAANSGGGITVAGTLNMNGGTIANIHMHNSSNVTTQYGAAITVAGGTVNMYDGIIGGADMNSGDRNDGRNGAVGVVSGTFNMYGGAISGNVANEQGGGAGGVHISAAGTFNMYGGSVSNNSSRRNGGGFYNQGTLNIIDGLVSGNTATYTDKNNDPTIFFGAGIYNTGTLNISGGEISGNVAKSCGGGVYNLGTMTLSGGKISGNTSQGFSAGGIFVDGSGTLNITGGEISGNTAGQYGGAIAVTSNASNALVITDCIFSGNACGANQCGSDIYITTANSSNVRTSYDYECIHFQLYVDRTGARYSASNAVAATSSTLTSGYGYVYVGSGEGHAWGEWTVITPATCTVAGSMRRVCANDPTHVQTQAIPALGHSWNAGVITVQPTCTAAGTKLFTCTRCGETKTEPVAALGHDKSGATTVPATCTEAGHTSYTCPRCGQTFSETIPALGHDPRTVRVEPTCTVAGSTTTTCTRCGVVLSSTVLPAKGHTPGDWEVVTPATKTSTGLKVIKCTVCGATIQSEVIPVIPDATVKAATVEVATVPANSVKVPVTFVGNEGVWSMGFYVVYDAELSLKGVLAGDVFEDIETSAYDVDPATNARAAAALQAAGVSTSGVKCYRLYAENYLFENITNDGKICDLVFNVPNTTAYELPVKIVPVEGLTINVDNAEISLLKEDGAILIPSNNNCDHSSFTWVVTTAATCTAAGSRAKVCDDCGRTLATETIPALGHAYGAYVVTTPATCTAAGQETSTCSRCGAKQYRDIPALGHTYSEFVTTKEATCTEDGTLTATCTRCGAVITDVIPALGHVEGEWVITKEAHGAVAGERVKYCTRCGEVLKTEIIPAPETPALVGSIEEAEGNTTVNATITFNSNPGVYSMVLYVYYDEALTLNSVTNGAVYAANELTVSNNLRLNPDYKAFTSSAFTQSGVDPAGKKIAAVYFLPSAEADVYNEGVLLNLSFTTPDVLEGNYVFGVVNNTDDIYNYAEEDITIAKTSGEIVVKESVCDHVWSAWTTVDAATCTEAGSEERTCSVCGKTETRTIEALGHNITNPTRVEPTCTEAGYEGGTCSRCGELIATTIPALGHNWGEWTQVDDTHLQRVCARCGETETREITADPTLSVIGKNVREGETFTVPVMMTGNPGTYSLLAIVYFDEALHLDSVANGTVFAASELEVSANLNRLPADSANATAAFSEWGVNPAGYRFVTLFYQCDASADNTNNGLLATLTFTAPEEEGSYFVGIMDLSEEVYNYAEDEIVFGFENSEVVVSACNHVAGNIETVPATCTENGYIRTYCSICGNVIDETVLNAKGHQPGEWEIVTPATASSTGLKVKKCTVCGTVLEEKEIPPVGAPVISIGEATVYAGEEFTLPVTIDNNPGIWGLHVYFTYPEAATVKSITEGTILGEFETGELNMDPASNDISAGVFAEVGESVVGVRTVSVLMNNEDSEDTTANGKLFDATFNGLPVGSYRIFLVMSEDECYNWDEVNVPVYLEEVLINVIERPSCEHANTTTETVAPTCTAAGYTRVVCTDCGTIISNVVTPALGHDYVETARVEPTCTAAGSKTETCSRCGDVKVTTLPALGHEWSDWAEVDGHLERVCARCGEVETKPIPTTPTLTVGDKSVEAGEQFTVDVVLSGNPGTYSLLAIVYFDEALHLDSVANGEVFTVSEFEPSSNLNRNPADSANATAAFEAWNISPAGYRVATLFYQCDESADNTNNGVLATLTFTAPAAAGTYTVGIMDLPEEVYNYAEDEIVYDFDNGEIVVTAHVHSWSDWAVTTPATCTTAGVETRTCSCGESETRAIAALGHDWGAWTKVDSTHEQRVCSRCGEVETRTIVVPVYTLGDVNGDGKVNSRDRRLLKQYLSGEADLESIVFANTDINNDGKINSRDLSLLKRYISGDLEYTELLAFHGDF